MTTTITEKGQVTIPIQLRRQFNLKKGSRCVFMVRNNELVLVPFSKKPTLDEICKLLAEGVPSSEEFMAAKKEEKALEF